MVFNQDDITVVAADNRNQVQVSGSFCFAYVAVRAEGHLGGKQDGLFSVICQDVQFMTDRCVCVCVCWQVQNGMTGQVMFLSEKQESRIRCTCLCREPLAAVLGCEGGAVKVGMESLPPFSRHI